MSWDHTAVVPDAWLKVYPHIARKLQVAFGQPVPKLCASSQMS